jgi:hypothetical protein
MQWSIVAHTFTSHYYTFDALLKGRHEALSNPEISCEARGWHDISGLDKASCLPTSRALYCLLYRHAN